MIILLYFIGFRLLLSILNNYWLYPGRLRLFIYICVQAIISLTLSLNSNSKIKGLTHLVRTLFLSLILLNIQGLIPFNLGVTSHLVVTLPLALTIWFGLILSDFFFNRKKFIGKLVPAGAPNWLASFLVWVESLRLTARPVTLRFRLAANLSTGHIILTLIGVYITVFFFTKFLTVILVILPVKIIYIILEVGICFIQAYIFSLLVCLYAGEHS